MHITFQLPGVVKSNEFPEMLEAGCIAGFLKWYCNFTIWLAYPQAASSTPQTNDTHNVTSAFATEMWGKAFFLFLQCWKHYFITLSAWKQYYVCTSVPNNKWDHDLKRKRYRRSCDSVQHWSTFRSCTTDKLQEYCVQLRSLLEQSRFLCTKWPADWLNCVVRKSLETQLIM